MARRQYYLEHLVHPLDTTDIGGRQIPTRWSLKIPAKQLDITTQALNPSVTGREAQCRKAKYVETGRLAGAAAGAAGAGVLGAELTRRACTVFLGIATRGSGALTCGIIGGAAGGYIGGRKGGDGGALLGGKIIEKEGDLIFQPAGA